jgi:hypothetical protein
MGGFGRKRFMTVPGASGHRASNQALDDGCLL